MATGGRRRLKVPKLWRLPQAPLYTPHPDSTAHYLRCLWCLTRLDPDVPAKCRRCPLCGHQGATTYPLCTNTIYVEQCEPRRKT
jgi:hypothetical protein